MDLFNFIQKKKNILKIHNLELEVLKVMDQK